MFLRDGEGILPSTVAPTLRPFNPATRALMKYFVARELCVCSDRKGINAKCPQAQVDLVEGVKLGLMRMDQFACSPAQLNSGDADHLSGASVTPRLS